MRLILPLLGAGMALLSGCSAIDEQYHAMHDSSEPAVYAENNEATETAEQEQHIEEQYRPDSRDKAQSEEQAQRGWHDPLQYGYQPDRTHKGLVDYASQLAMQLMDNATQITSKDLIGVASFVRLNRSLQEPTVMGNQLSELLIAELQGYGLGIVDFKMADGLTVTPYGDLAMTRSGLHAIRQMKMDHLVTGTIIEEPRGVRVNARIVATENHQVVASTTLFIPSFIVQQLNQPALAAQH